MGVGREVRRVMIYSSLEPVVLLVGKEITPCCNISNLLPKDR